MGFGKGFGLGLGRGRGLGYGLGFGEGKGGLSGYSCVKYVFFGFNVFFWLLGCAVLGVGIWLHVSKGSFASLSPSYNFLSATILCISAGVLILVVGFFGCCGAIMESKCLLMAYFVVVVVIFVLEVVVGALAFVYRVEIEDMVAEELLKGIREKYPATDAADVSAEQAGLVATWHYVQTSLKCCGVYNYSDWFYINAWPAKNYVPKECCKKNATECNTPPQIKADEQKKADDKTIKDYYQQWYQKGCMAEGKGQFERNLYILGIVTVCIGLVQLIGLIASMSLFCCLHREKFYEDE